MSGFVERVNNHFRGGFRPNLVVSFPKSGRTWLRVMLDAAGAKVGYTHLGAGHRPGIDYRRLDLVIPARFRRVVVLLRDPRDTVVSGFHHASRRIKVFDGTIGEFIRDPGHGIDKIVHVNLEMARLCSARPGGLIVSYEEMKADAAAVLARVAGHFGVGLSAARAGEIAEQSSFGSMQQRERSGDFSGRYGGILRPGSRDDPTSFKVRRGLVGGYREELSDDDVRYVDEVLRRERYFERIAELTARVGIAAPAA